MMSDLTFLQSYFVRLDFCLKCVTTNEREVYMFHIMQDAGFNDTINFVVSFIYELAIRGGFQ